MKKWITTLLTASMIAACLTACGGSGSQTKETAAETSQTETEEKDVSAVTAGGDAKIADEITIARIDDVTNLDPVLLNYTADIQIVNMICEELVTTNDEGTEIIPSLAESWDVSEDGLTYTFHVKEGLKFSDGTDVTADDWKFSFEPGDDHTGKCMELFSS